MHSDFHTKSESNPWIRVDLKGYKLKPSSYILQSAYNDNRLLQNWRMDGIKEDGTSVALLYGSHTFCKHEIKEFPCKVDNYFVAFKLIQTGKNQSKSDDLCI